MTVGNVSAALPVKAVLRIVFKIETGHQVLPGLAERRERIGEMQDRIRCVENAPIALKYNVMQSAAAYIKPYMKAVGGVPGVTIQSLIWLHCWLSVAYGGPFDPFNPCYSSPLPRVTGEAPIGPPRDTRSRQRTHGTIETRKCFDAKAPIEEHRNKLWRSQGANCYFSPHSCKKRRHQAVSYS